MSQFEFDFDFDFDFHPSFCLLVRIGILRNIFFGCMTITGLISHIFYALVGYEKCFKDFQTCGKNEISQEYL